MIDQRQGEGLSDSVEVSCYGNIQRKKTQQGNLLNIRATLPRSRKLEKSKKNYNFFKKNSIVVDIGSHILKFDFGLINESASYASYASCASCAS